VPREAADASRGAGVFPGAVEGAAAGVGGVATPRVVAREVRRWLGEKTAREQAAIQGATEALGRSDLTPGVLPRPMESGSQPSQPHESLVRPIPLDDTTLGAKPSTLTPAQPAQSKKTWIPIVIVTALLFAAGAGLAVLVMGPNESQA